MMKAMMRGHFCLILAISSAEPLSPIVLPESEPGQHEDLSFCIMLMPYGRERHHWRTLFFMGDFILLMWKTFPYRNGIQEVHERNTIFISG